MGHGLQGATIVFDLDGTLVDTAPDLLRALNAVLVEAGLRPAPEAAVRHLVGHGARAMLEGGAALAGIRLPGERLDALTERFVEIYRADIALLSRPFPGAEAALDTLMAEGALLAVCTNKRTQLAIQLLEELGLAFRFAAIVGADAVPSRKPDPAHLIETVHRAGGAATRAIMVGDSAADIAAAKGAGIPVVAVTFGYGEDVETLEPDHILADFASLRTLARAALRQD